jgi:hypothetical protein
MIDDEADRIDALQADLAALTDRVAELESVVVAYLAAPGRLPFPRR